MGLTARAVVGNVPLFLVLTILAFAGMGLGNVLVPPFIASGERIVVDTNEITYLRRAD